jgi:stalled ribosome rescue protein Dom34
MRTTIVIHSSEFEPGKRPVALGGIAALLRYQLTR